MAAGTIDNEDQIQASAEPPTPPGQPPPLTASPSQAPAPGQPPLGAGSDAVSAGGNGIENPPKQKGKIDTGPKVEFDPKKMAKVNTAEDLVNAMRPASRTEYLDWWEKTHGNINDKYDNMQKQLGARPADDQDMSRKEKFSALLSFGLHLMKASAATQGNQGAVMASTLSDETDKMNANHQAGIKAQQSAYDTQSNAIEASRTQDLQSIGTAQSARKGQLDSDKAYATGTKDNMTSLKTATDIINGRQPPAGSTTYSTGPDGTVNAIKFNPETGRTEASPVTGIDGKPYKGKILGREAGSGIDKGDTAQIRNNKYLTSVLGLDPSAAASIAFKPKSNDAMKDHKDVYSKVLAATFGDTDKAKAASDQYVIDNYGAGALTTATAPLVPPKASGGTNPIEHPPPAKMKGLAPGAIRDFGAKGRWQLLPDGSTKYLGPGSQQAGAPQGQ